MSKANKGDEVRESGPNWEYVNESGLADEIVQAIEANVEIHLVNILNDSHNPSNIRAKAVAALAKCRTHNSALVVVRALSSAHNDVAAQARRCMIELGPVGMAALCEEASKFDTTQVPTQSQIAILTAINGICAVGDYAVDALPTILHLYTAWRTEAANWLAENEAAKTSDPWANIRSILVQSLVSVSAPEVLPLLESMLYDPNDAVQGTAIDVAGKVVQRIYNGGQG